MLCRFDLSVLTALNLLAVEIFLKLQFGQFEKIKSPLPQR
jgi:hypothetical protein